MYFLNLFPRKISILQNVDHKLSENTKFEFIQQISWFQTNTPRRKDHDLKYLVCFV